MASYRGAADGLLGINTRKLFQEGEIIFFEGDEPNYVYVILRGAVKLYKAGPNGVIDLTTLKEKQMFGEFAILEEKEGRNASAIATEVTELLLIPREQFKRKFEALDPFTRYWILYLKETIMDLTTRINS